MKERGKRKVMRVGKEERKNKKRKKRKRKLKG